MAPQSNHSLSLAGELTLAGHALGAEAHPAAKWRHMLPLIIRRSYVTDDVLALVYALHGHGPSLALSSLSRQAPLSAGRQACLFAPFRSQFGFFIRKGWIFLRTYWSRYLL